MISKLSVCGIAGLVLAGCANFSADVKAIDVKVIAECAKISVFVSENQPIINEVDGLVSLSGVNVPLTEDAAVLIYNDVCTVAKDIK